MEERIYFHGTTVPYYEKMLEKFGEYKHEAGKPVWLGETIETAERKSIEFLF